MIAGGATAPTNPLITVLTAVRNGARFLEETIASIRAQTMTDWEYIVVDDASEDESVAIVERVMRSDPRLRLLKRASVGGPYVAANDGLREARGRYVARIDADDVAPSSRFDVQLSFLKDHPQLRACGGLDRPMSETGELLSVVQQVPLGAGALRWRLCVTTDLVHSSAFVERSAFEELGGYRPLPLAQDWRLWCELSRRGWLGVVPDVVIHRRAHGGQMSARDPDLQTGLALDVARDHLQALTGLPWPIEDVRLLRLAVHGRGVGLRRGLQLIDRWASLWKADGSLSPDERQDLAAWTRWIKRRYVRSFGEALPMVGPIVRVGLNARARLRRFGPSASS